LFKAALGKTAGGLLARLPLVPKLILGRLMVALCYLHSDDSGGVQLRLERKVGTARGALVAEPKRTPRTARVVRGLGRKLLRHAPALGFAAAAPAVHIASPGRGYHSGGTFPMNAHPSDAQTDVLGRLAAWRRVHLVDASVMPTIPSATITYSVMANAHRIASRVMES
jgi:choline dehydrogenase-like flavoprotein